MIKGKKLVVIVLVLSMVITGVYQPSGVVAEAASEVKLAVYMPRNGIHHDKDGTYLYTEIESGDAISHYEKTDTSNVVISEKQESFNKGSFNYARISSDVAVVSTNVIRMDGDGNLRINDISLPYARLCGSSVSIKPLGYVIRSVQGEYITGQLCTVDEENRTQQISSEQLKEIDGIAVQIIMPDTYKNVFHFNGGKLVKGSGMDHWFPLSAKAGEKMKGSGENAFFRNARNYNQWDELYNGLAYHTGGTTSYIPAPVRQGYSFVGWHYEGCECLTGGSLYQATTMSVDQDFYAKWKAKEYTVYLNSNDGKNSLQEKTVTYDSAYGTLPVLRRKGYQFEGWYTQKEEGRRITESVLCKTDQDHYLYAHWTPEQVTVSWNANGGVCEEKSRTYNYGQVYGTLPVPEKTGYTFKGWAFDQEGKERIYENSICNGGGTLYALWEVNDYKVVCVDRLENGEVLGQTEWMACYGTEQSGSRLGTDSTIGKYYKDMQYVSATNAVVNENGCQVERIFKSFEGAGLNGLDIQEHTLIQADKSIETIHLPADITAIGDNALQECTKLREISFSPALKKIGMNAFLNCTSLEKIDFRPCTEKVEIEEDAFKGCDNLQSMIEGMGEIAVKDPRAIPGQTVIQCYGTGFLYEYVKANERDCILIFGKGKDTRSFLTRSDCVLGSKIKGVELGYGICEVKGNALTDCLGWVKVENPNCRLEDRTDVFSSQSLLQGWSQSSVMEYGRKYGRNMESIGNSYKMEAKDQGNVCFVLYAYPGMKMPVIKGEFINKQDFLGFYCQDTLYYRRDGSCVEEVFTAKETSDVELEARWEKKEEITPAPTNTPVVSGPPVDTKEPTETEEPVPTASPEQTSTEPAAPTKPAVSVKPGETTSKASATTPAKNTQSLKATAAPKSIVITFSDVAKSEGKNIGGITMKKGKITYRLYAGSRKAVVWKVKKKKKKVVVPAVIKYKKKNYIVTEIRSKAFASNKHIKSVVLGKNVCLIGEKAFYRCSNLKRIQFKGNLIRKVGKKALKGISNKCRILVPKKMEKKVRKRLEKKGQNKKVTIRTKG